MGVGGGGGGRRTAVGNGRGTSQGCCCRGGGVFRLQGRGGGVGGGGWGGGGWCHPEEPKMGRVSKGLGTRCNFLTSATSGLPQVAIQIAVLAAHVATLNRSPRSPIPNKENSRGTIRDFSFAQAMGHRVTRNAAL